MLLTALGLVCLGLLFQRASFEHTAHNEKLAALQQQTETLSVAVSTLRQNKEALETAIAAAERRRQTILSEIQQHEARIPRLREEHQSLEARSASVRHQLTLQQERLQSLLNNANAAVATRPVVPLTVPFTPGNAPVPEPAASDLPAASTAPDTAGAPVVPGHKPKPR